MNTQHTPEPRQPPAPGAEQRAAIWATKCRIALFSGRTGHGQTNYVTYLQMRPPAVEQLARESFLAGFNIATSAEPQAKLIETLITVRVALQHYADYAPDNNGWARRTIQQIDLVCPPTPSPPAS